MVCRLVLQQRTPKTGRIMGGMGVTERFDGFVGAALVPDLTSPIILPHDSYCHDDFSPDFELLYIIVFD